jgi:hypothetical protein
VANNLALTGAHTSANARPDYGSDVFYIASYARSNVLSYSKPHVWTHVGAVIGTYGIAHCIAHTVANCSSDAVSSRCSYKQSNFIPVGTAHSVSNGLPHVGSNAESDKWPDISMCFDFFWTNGSTDKYAVSRPHELDGSTLNDAHAPSFAGSNRAANATANTVADDWCNFCANAGTVAGSNTESDRGSISRTVATPHASAFWRTIANSDISDATALVRTLSLSNAFAVVLADSNAVVWADGCANFFPIVGAYSEYTQAYTRPITRSNAVTFI